MKISNDITELIGNTPIVKLKRVPGDSSASVYLKMESFNIGGSMKDRTALYLFEYAQSSGLLKGGRNIIEATSGNTGIALSMLGAAKGVGVTILMSEGVSIERRKIISAYGSELILTPAEKGTAGAIEVKEELLRRYPDRYVSLDQFSNPVNVMAHYNSTSRELIDQMDGRIDSIVMSVGTGGSSSGVSMRMREEIPGVRIIGVTAALGVKIEGIRSPKEPNPSKLVRINAFDELHEITEAEKKECFETTRKAASSEGILLGMSSGCVLHYALKEAKKLGKGKNVVCLMPDNGFKYLSTDLFVDLGKKWVG
ncbi:PLP-dependent cysteine synthase family protein [Oxyplasma meridianum]|uniref:PLP-dependent cysteine synthase family protein n=1 Tax=Oxyplasma meridianum TaxID=3073602 RepID=A0AAX4NHG8_9ARCH